MNGIKLNDMFSLEAKEKIFLKFWVLFFAFVYLYEKHKDNPKVRAYFKLLKANPKSNFEDLFPPLQFLILSSKTANIPKPAVNHVFKFFAKMKKFSIDSIDLDSLKELVKSLKYNSQFKPDPKFFKSIENFLETGNYDDLFKSIIQQFIKHPEFKKEFSSLFKLLKQTRSASFENEKIKVPKIETSRSEISELVDLNQLVIKLSTFKMNEKLWRSPFTQFLNFTATKTAVKNVISLDDEILLGTHFDIWAKNFLNELIKFNIVRKGDLTEDAVKENFKRIFLKEYKRVLMQKSSQALKDFVTKFLPYFTEKVDSSLFKSERDLEHFVLYNLLYSSEKFESKIFPELKGTALYKKILNYSKKFNSKHSIILGALEYFIFKGFLSFDRAKNILGDYLGNDINLIFHDKDLNKELERFLDAVFNYDIFQDRLDNVKASDEIVEMFKEPERLTSFALKNTALFLRFVKEFFDKMDFEKTIFSKIFDLKRDEFVLDPHRTKKFKPFSIFDEILSSVHSAVSQIPEILNQIDSRYLFFELLNFSFEKNLVEAFVKRFPELLKYTEFFDFSSSFENLNLSENGRTVFAAYLLLESIRDFSQEVEVFKRIESFLEKCEIKDLSKDIIFRYKRKWTGTDSAAATILFIVKSLAYRSGQKEALLFVETNQKGSEFRFSRIDSGDFVFFNDLKTVLTSDLNGFVKDLFNLHREAFVETLKRPKFLNLLFSEAHNLSADSVEIIEKVSKLLGAVLNYERTRDPDVFLDITSEDIENDYESIKMLTKSYFRSDPKKSASVFIQPNLDVLEFFIHDIIEFTNTDDLVDELKQIYAQNKERFMIFVENTLALEKKFEGTEVERYSKDLLKTVLNYINLDKIKDKLFDPKHSKELVPLIEPKNNFIVEALKFNGILPIQQIRIDENETKESIKELIEKIENQNVILSEPKIELIDLDMKGLAKETEYLSQFLTDDFRHGDIAPIVLKVWKADVVFPEFEAFKSVYSDTVMDPVFHGTGSFAAAFILRYGFRVVKGKLEKAGKMLGDGIYFTNVIDKALQYVGDLGFTRSHGIKGYILQMEAVLGEKGKHYRSAGLKNDVIKSPEWCVYDPRSQLRIYKVYLVQIVSRKSMFEFIEKHL